MLLFCIIGILLGQGIIYAQEQQTQTTQLALNALEKAFKNSDISEHDFKRATDILKHENILDSVSLEGADPFAFRSIPSSLLEAVPTGCPLYDGKTCNGEESGDCSGTICNCKGEWTGIACHVPPALKDFNPRTGTAEPTKQCESLLVDVLSNC